MNCCYEHAGRKSKRDTRNTTKCESGSLDFSSGENVMWADHEAARSGVSSGPDVAPVHGSAYQSAEAMQ